MMNQTVSRFVLFVLVYTFVTGSMMGLETGFVMQLNISIFIGLLFMIVMKLTALVEKQQPTNDEGKKDDKKQL
ncbi:MAG TPA: hypothetical protein DCR24_14855 [Bacillus bacterium]|nr:hypothetical protein [Bacillus sp. (in: firmicutes)]